MKHDLEKLSDEALLSNTRALVREETRLTTDVLHHLREVERRQLYAQNYSSLFEYAVHDLGYAETSANLRIASMRLMKELPKLEEQITKGDITLSVAAQARTFFNQEEKAGKKLTQDEKEAVVERLEGKTTRQADQTLAGLSSEPKKPKPDYVKSIDGKLSEVRFTANEELLKDLEQLKGLLAHQHPHLTFGELFAILAERALKVLDPARKEVRARKEPAKSPHVERHENTEVKAPDSPPAQVVIFKRVAIPAATNRAVWKRDGSRCAHICAKTGMRCASRYMLQIDHRVPPCMGGTNELSNLRLACRTHNIWAAVLRYGAAHMQRYRRP
jgi:5-methylcytosine-specific restriction endonuclease McrA